MSKPLPIVAMRSGVLFPGMSLPISAARPQTLRAIEAALREPEHQVFVVAQRDDGEEIKPDDLYTIGTVATVAQVQRGLGGARLVLEGNRRGIAVRVTHQDGYLVANLAAAPEHPPAEPTGAAFVALHREVRARAAELARKRGLPEEAVEQMLQQITEPGQLADLVAGYLEVSIAERQELLETFAIEDRLRRVVILVQRQIDVLAAQEDIQSRVKEELGGRQREVYLREQLKAIQKELGEDDEAGDDALKELKAKLDALPLEEVTRKEVNREYSRLARIGRESMESQVIRTYLETIAELPWGTRTEELLDVAAAAKVLDEDHHGLGEVKDRVLEFLAVHQLSAGRVGTGLMSTIPAGQLRMFLKDPEISVVVPEIASSQEPITLSVHVNDFIHPDRIYSASLEVSAAQLDRRTFEMNSVNGQSLQCTFTPLPALAAFPTVMLKTEYSGGQIQCEIPNVEVMLDDRRMMLAELRRISKADTGYSVTTIDEETFTVNELRQFPGEGSLGNTNVKANFAAADRLSISIGLRDHIKYTLMIQHEGETVAERTGIFELDERTATAARTTVEEIPLGEFELLGTTNGLPKFLDTSAALESTYDLGIRLPSTGAIRSKVRHLLDQDFTFDALVRFEQGDKIAYFGLGPGIPDSSYNGLTDSVYLRLHAPWHGVGGMDIENWRLGSSPMRGKINWVGTHRVRLTKKGSALQYHVDPDNDGPSDDDINLVIPNIAEFSPFLNRKNCTLFMSGTGTILSARFSISPSSVPKVEEETPKLANELPSFLEKVARYQLTRDGGIRIMSGQPIGSVDRNFLTRDFTF